MPGIRSEDVVAAIEELFPHEAIWNLDHGADARYGRYLVPDVVVGRTDVEFDVWEYWNDEDRPSIDGGKDIWSSAVDIVRKDHGEEAGNALEEADPVSSKFDGDELEAALKVVLPSLDQAKIDVLLFDSLRAWKEEWWNGVDWPDADPMYALGEEFLANSQHNWIVSADAGVVMNLAQGYSNRGIPTLERFMEIAQEKRDEAEEARIEEIDIDHAGSADHLPRSVQEVEKQLEGRTPDEQLIQSDIEALLRNVPGYIRRDIIARIGTEATVAELQEAVARLDPMTFHVERGEKEYKGATISDVPYTFAFYPTDEIWNAVVADGKQIAGEPGWVLARKLYGQSLPGHYGEAIAYIRIDGEPEWIAVPSVGESGKAWVVENIQSDFMRSIYRYLDKEVIGKLAVDYKLSKQKVHRIVNALINRFSDWTDMVIDYLEDAARRNNIRYLIWTNAEIQANRWGGASDETLERFYEKLPAEEGFKKIEDPIKLYGEVYADLWVKDLGARKGASRLKTALGILGQEDLQPPVYEPLIPTDSRQLELIPLNPAEQERLQQEETRRQQAFVAEVHDYLYDLFCQEEPGKYRMEDPSEDLVEDNFEQEVRSRVEDMDESDYKTYAENNSLAEDARALEGFYEYLFAKNRVSADDVEKVFGKLDPSAKANFLEGESLQEEIANYGVVSTMEWLSKGYNVDWVKEFSNEWPAFIGDYASDEDLEKFIRDSQGDWLRGLAHDFAVESLLEQLDEELGDVLPVKYEKLRSLCEHFDTLPPLLTAAHAILDSSAALAPGLDDVVEHIEEEYNSLRSKHPFLPATIGGAGAASSKVEYVPGKEFLRTLLKEVEVAGGAIPFREIKKRYPWIENWSFKDRIVKGNNVTTQSIQAYLDSSGNTFDVSYKGWTGLQRSRNVRQTVLRLDMTEEMLEGMTPPARKVMEYLLKEGTYAGHPVRSQETIGWARIDPLSDTEWFVDEIQSDVYEQFLKLDEVLAGVADDSRDLPKGWPTLWEKGQDVADPSAMYRKVKPQIEKVLGQWEYALIQAVAEAAREKGVKMLYLATDDTLRITRGGLLSEGGMPKSRKVRRYYEKLPQQMGFQPGEISFVPRGDEEEQEHTYRIWQKKIASKISRLAARIGRPPFRAFLVVPSGIETRIW